MKTLGTLQLLCGLLELGWLSLQATAQLSQVNVAINKTYSQISEHSEQGPSSNAANSNTSGVYGPTNCIQTNYNNNYSRPVPNDTNHWWEVDLGRTYPVRDIYVWARDNFDNLYSNLNSFLYPFTITVDGQTCVNVTSPPSYGTRNNSVTCSSVMYGRVVRLTLIRNTATLNLCEFQILVPRGVSRCEAGRHGDDCKQNCSKNCGGGPGKNFCYQETGFCYSGCTGNYAGATCTGCKSGYYGDQCTSRCSSLSSRCTQCSQDGTCTACSGHFMPRDCTNCTQGYYKQGDDCKQCNSDCMDSQCDQDTGMCAASGSSTGRSGGGASLLLPLFLGILLACICPF